jgi:hypothetical protein
MDTIENRWLKHVKASNLGALSVRDQLMCKMMFFAGFSDSLNAGMEIAALDEEPAVAQLRAYHTECDRVADEFIATLSASGPAQ